MRLETAERVVRWAGAAGVFAFTLVVLNGLREGARRPKGRESGSGPFVARGSLAFYLPAAIVGLWIGYRLWRPLPLRLSPAVRAVALAVGGPLLASGLALMFWGRATLGRMYDVSSGFGARLYADHQLITGGPFALVRHPMYLGAQMAEIGALLIYRTWSSALIGLNALTLVQRARREEEALAAEFGAAWEAYRARVPFLYPRLAEARRR